MHVNLAICVANQDAIIALVATLFIGYRGKAWDKGMSFDRNGLNFGFIDNFDSLRLFKVGSKQSIALSDGAPAIIFLPIGGNNPRSVLLIIKDMQDALTIQIINNLPSNLGQ